MWASNDDLTWARRRWALDWIKAYWECLMDKRPVRLIYIPGEMWRQGEIW